MIRIGQGYDVHKLVTGRRLILCGVPVPHPTGLLGHSDADVAVHALMDAILGALALGDIGQRFPDSDPAWKDADSMKLLKAVMADPRVSEWEIANLDLTIIAQKPKLLPFNLEMRANLARTLNLRQTPELIFKYDTSIAKGAEIEKILNKIRNDEKSGRDDEDEQ